MRPVSRQKYRWRRLGSSNKVCKWRESKLMIRIQKRTYLSFICCWHFVSFYKTSLQISVRACDNSAMACKNNYNPVHLTTILCQFVLGLAMDSTVLLRFQFFNTTASRVTCREFWVDLCVQLESLSFKLTTLIVFQVPYLLNFEDNCSMSIQFRLRRSLWMYTYSAHFQNILSRKSYIIH